MAFMSNQTIYRLLLSVRWALLVIATVIPTAASGSDGGQETVPVGVGLCEGHPNGEIIYIGRYKVRESQTSDEGDEIPISPSEETTEDAAQYKFEPNVLYIIDAEDRSLYANIDDSIAELEPGELPFRLIPYPYTSATLLQNGTVINIWINKYSYWVVEIKLADDQPDQGTLYNIVSSHFDHPAVLNTLSYLQLQPGEVTLQLVIGDVSNGTLGSIRDGVLIRYYSNPYQIHVSETIRPVSEASANNTLSM